MSFSASAQAIAPVRSWAEGSAFLGAKLDSRRICGDNTYVERREGGSIAVRLHQTDIITFYTDQIVLNTDGWHTQITKQRLEQFLPAPLTVYSFKGQWRVGLKDGQRWATPKADNANSVVFTDGLILRQVIGGGWEPVNALTAEAEEKLDAAKRELDKAVKAYCKKLVTKVPEWFKQVRETNSLNVAGDPWCCSLFQDKGTDHLWAHLKEGYVFPTIIVRAFEDSGRWEGGGFTAAQRAVAQIAFGNADTISKEVAKYLRKKLDPFANPDAASADPKSNAALEHYADIAKDVLTMPEDFGYFGGDINLWKFSAPTFTKHRDSDNIEIANFDIVWETLKAEFPDLFHEELDDDGYVTRDFATWPAIYVFGAGHWAVGHIDQIVVPVVQDRDRPVGPTNLHPAFIRVSELAKQAKLYPALPGAEERAAKMDVEQELADIKGSLQFLENTKEWPVGWLTEHDISTAIVQDLGEEYDWSTDQVQRAIVVLCERLAHDENNAALPGQGVLV